MEEDGGGGGMPPGEGCTVDQGSLSWQTETVDEVGQCGEEEDQLEGHMGHGSETDEVFNQSCIQCPSNTS